MKIAISGAQSTGKSTLLESLKTDPAFTKFMFIESPTRKIEQQGLNINELGDDKTQRLIASKHMENIELSDNSILDRCILDGYVYTTYLFNHKKVTKDTLIYVGSVFHHLIKKYDVIFYIPPEFDVVKDGIRSIDKSFRDEVVDIFEEYIQEYRIPVERITGTVKERLQRIKNIIDDVTKAENQEKKAFKQFEKVLNQQIETLKEKK
jgi:nicotinamide riboside kinase